MTLIDKIKNLFKKTDVKQEKRAQPVAAAVKTNVESKPVQFNAIIEETKKAIFSRIDQLNFRLDDQNKEITRLKEELGAVRQERDEYKARLDDVEENLGDLQALYELVSKDINPFTTKDADEKKPDSAIGIKTPIESANSPETKITEHIDPQKGHPDIEKKPEEINHVNIPTGNKRLETIGNEATSTIVLLDWIQKLLDSAGKDNFPHILEYYVQIGWISDSVLSQMKTYADGISINQSKNNFPTQLSVKEHVTSLFYIEKLRGNTVDKQALGTIESELSAFKKCAETACAAV